MMKVTMYLLTYHQQKHYKDEQTKVNQEAVSSEVSKFNHAVINKKQGDQMQFSLRKKKRKKKMGSSNPLYQSVDCVIKWGNRFINSIRISFICLMKCLSCNRGKIAEMS